MERVAVVGSSGSGKSTVAECLAEILGCPWLELDSICHQPNWQTLDHETFRERVGEFANREPRWIIDSNSSQVSDLIWNRADTVVWLDLPRSKVALIALARKLPTILNAMVRDRTTWKQTTS